MKLILTNEAGELASASLTVDQNVAEGTGEVKLGFTCRMPDVARSVVRGLKALDDIAHKSGGVRKSDNTVCHIILHSPQLGIY